ncbi:hypothetical protein FDECE_11863 [Fusarium decemcellulare]|nr:hypothetical protein FDECE_11863 [Fusarium decemcellulare]
MAGAPTALRFSMVFERRHKSSRYQSAMDVNDEGELMQSLPAEETQPDTKGDLPRAKSVGCLLDLGQSLLSKKPTSYQDSAVYLKLFDSILEFVAMLSSQRSNPLRQLPDRGSTSLGQDSKFMDADMEGHGSSLDSQSQQPVCIDDSMETSQDDSLAPEVPPDSPIHWKSHQGRLTRALDDLVGWQLDFGDGDLSSMFAGSSPLDDLPVKNVMRLLISIGERLVGNIRVRRVGVDLEGWVNKAKQIKSDDNECGNSSVTSNIPHITKFRNDGAIDPLKGLEKDTFDLIAMDLASTLRRKQHAKREGKQKRRSQMAPPPVRSVRPRTTELHHDHHLSISHDSNAPRKGRWPPTSPLPSPPIFAPKLIRRTSSTRRARSTRAPKSRVNWWASVDEKLYSITSTWSRTRPPLEIDKLVEDRSQHITLLIASDPKEFEFDRVHQSIESLQGPGPTPTTTAPNTVNVLSDTLGRLRIKDETVLITAELLAVLRDATPKLKHKMEETSSGADTIHDSLNSIDFTLYQLQSFHEWGVYTDKKESPVANALRTSVEASLVDEFLDSSTKLFAKLQEFRRAVARDPNHVRYLIAFLYQRVKCVQNIKVGLRNGPAWEGLQTKLEDLLFALRFLFTEVDTTTPVHQEDIGSYFGTELTRNSIGDEMEACSPPLTLTRFKQDECRIDAFSTANVPKIPQRPPSYLFCSLSGTKFNMDTPEGSKDTAALPHALKESSADPLLQQGPQEPGYVHSTSSTGEVASSEKEKNDGDVELEA